MSRKSEATGWFIGLAVFSLALGLVVGGVTGSISDFSAFQERILSGGLWPFATRVMLLLGAVAAVLTIADSVFGGSKGEESGSYGDMLSHSVDATLNEVRERVQECMAGEEPNVPGGMDELLRGALLLRASDVHLNPLPSGAKVTYRVDGVLHEVAALPLTFGARLTGRVKVLARLDSYSHEPQDGSLRRKVGDVDVEARVSVLPANHGERVVLRLVRGNERIPEIKELGFDREVANRLETLLHKPEGILYVSGPVGSGKTTTLYSALQHVHVTRGETTSLVTLEDPIEMQLPFATQTQINQKQGMSFAQTLRSVLRQDPGALMIGEIRDRETAEIATQSGLTGHLILTTIHVTSAAGTFARLKEMDVESFILASSCAGTLAQRLVRGLCVECRKSQKPSADIVSRFARLGVSLTEEQYFEPVGCEACDGRGYLGRIPIAELMVMSERLREAVHLCKPTEEVHAIAVSEGMVPLIYGGLSLAKRGDTSLLEVLRVAG